MSKQPEALRLADELDWPDEDGFVASIEEQAAMELRRLHAINGELLDALNDLVLNVSEAMKTGGWVPTPLHESFWEAMANATFAAKKATGEQP